MKIGAISQNPLEWIAIQAKLLPMPLLYGHFGFMMSKFLLEAVDVGIFETIGQDKKNIAEIAQACGGLNEKALKGTLGVLASMGQMDEQNGQFSLTSEAKKYLLKDSPDSVYWMMLFDNRVCMAWMSYFPEFLRTGKGLQYHDTFNSDEWYLYQNAMESAAIGLAKEAMKKLPIAAQATQLLDIGGSHGLYSVGMCKKAPNLHATILDLPAAVEKARPILAKYGMGERITYRPGNILTDDIGAAQYDYILMVNVAHHFTPEENLLVTQKAHAALKPGGTFTILEFMRQDTIKKNGDMLGALGDLFFLLSSTAGLWSQSEVEAWMQQAGFAGIRIIDFLILPGFKAISGKK
ncbi:methyltransferase [Haliscomenobacter sp.]|uniref:methyltransferase n=1 Tax=Haliscomenobacter sp. TaxID=2717303 RepID=UPI003BAD9B57